MVLGGSFFFLGGALIMVVDGKKLCEEVVGLGRV